MGKTAVRHSVFIQICYCCPVITKGAVLEYGRWKLIIYVAWQRVSTVAKKKTKFDTMLNSYEVKELLGEGGSGKVYKVQDENNQFYALKYLNPQYVSQDKLKRFKNELHFCSNFDHSNIVKVLDWGFKISDELKSPFFVMPLYSTTLRKLMERAIKHDQVLRYFAQILDGVEAAHLMQTWHRDLKPENILYDSQSDQLIIADWGIAHFEADNLLTSVETKAQARLANFQYAAPEQRIKGRSVDQRSDIFALGMILNEMFTGILLQGSGYKTIESENPNFAYLDDLVSWMIQQQPDKRPSSIAEVKLQLNAKQNDFISLQKLSELQNKVVPKSEIDDPLINNPIKLVDIDYKRGDLLLKLSSNATGNWVDSFRSIRGYTYTMEIEPNLFGFQGDTAKISVTENQCQKAVDLFKEYLERANKQYKQKVENAQRRREENERQRIQAQIKEEETRRKILKNLKI